jgi:hypothetical protein
MKLIPQTNFLILSTFDIPSCQHSESQKDSHTNDKLLPQKGILPDKISEPNNYPVAIESDC